MKHKVKRLFPVLILMLGTGWFLIWESYHQLSLTKIHLESEKCTAPFSFILLGDLHDNTFGRDNEALIRLIEQARPDFVLMIGDMLNGDSDGSDRLERLIAALSRRAPVYYSLGNHELDYIRSGDEKLVSRLVAAGAIVLELEARDWQLRGQRLRIGGMYDYAFALDNRNTTSREAMNRETYDFLADFQDTEAFTLMLAHRPESFVLGQASRTWEIDLVVSGHDHGGQVVLPLLGGLWAGDQGWFPEYIHGLHKKDKLNILITSGLGSHAQRLPRFNNPPEVMLCMISPKE